MLEGLKIIGFKNIEHQNFDMKPITIFTGLNSAGKSTVLQAILNLSSLISKNSELNTYIKKFDNFNEVRNRYKNSKIVELSASESVFEIECKFLPSNSNGLQKEFTISTDWKLLEFQENLHYISSNRIGQEDLALFDSSIKFGIDGKYVLGFFEQNKDKKIDDKLIAFEEHTTLDGQLSYWFSQILGIDLRMVTEKITQDKVKITYNCEGIDNISPYNLGSGNSYLAKILIMGLSCKSNNILIIENPEIHLHPKAQSMLADFFIFLANAGVQVILETHSEHILNKLRYGIYKNTINENNINIYYKPSIKEDFLNIKINNKGHFINDKQEKINFPSGFFDATLGELLEIIS